MDLYDGTNSATFATNLGTGVSVVSQAFANFTNAGAVNFDNIQSIKVSLSGPASLDAILTLLEITTSPLTDTVPAD